MKKYIECKNPLEFLIKYDYHVCLITQVVKALFYDILKTSLMRNYSFSTIFTRLRAEKEGKIFPNCQYKVFYSEIK